jgi:rhamnose utilization protein RhaD (predicted bifunctional aldolase and dehydrogenase)
MINRWNDEDAREYSFPFVNKQVATDNGLLLLAYATTLLGAEKDLTMHGGGNTSIKKIIVDDNGEEKRALFVKASGTPLNTFTPEYFVAMDLDFLEGMRDVGGIDDETMSREFKSHQLIQSERLPSMESLMHAFLPADFVVHTHPAAILKIANREGGGGLLKECFGGGLAVVPYAKMGYDLAKAVSEAARQNSGCRGVVMAHHGLITWGGSAREAYDKSIEIITTAEKFLKQIFIRSITRGLAVSEDISLRNYNLIAPIIKECLYLVSKNIDGAGLSNEKISLTLLNTPDVMELINSPDGKKIIANPPMTPDYPMLTRILPLWLDVYIDNDEEKIFPSVKFAVDKYVSEYKAYLSNNEIQNITAADALPAAIVHPPTGVVCFGVNESKARQIVDFTRQAFSIRRAIAETGGVYESLPERYLFDMQYRGYQKSKKDM